MLDSMKLLVLLVATASSIDRSPHVLALMRQRDVSFLRSQGARSLGNSIENDEDQPAHGYSLSDDFLHSPHATAPTNNSSPTNNILIKTGMFAENIKKVVKAMPERWHVMAVVKMHAYGHDVNILGPVAAKLAPFVGILYNDHAKVFAGENTTIMRIGRTNYDRAKEAVIKKLNIVEFLGRQVEVDAVSKVSEETGKQVPAQLYLFDHYGDPWGWNVNTSEQLQKVVDKIDPKKIRITGLMAHLGFRDHNFGSPVPPITKFVNKFLRVACPVAVKLADKLEQHDAPILVSWASSRETMRMLKNGKLEIPEDVKEAYSVCFAHPKISFMIRPGGSLYGWLPMPGLWDEHSLISWHSKVSSIENGKAHVPVGRGDNFPLWSRGVHPEGGVNNTQLVFDNETKTTAGLWGSLLINKNLRNLTESPQVHSLTINADRDIKAGDDVCIICDEAWNRTQELWRGGFNKRHAWASCLTLTNFDDQPCFVYQKHTPGVFAFDQMTGTSTSKRSKCLAD